MQCEPLFLNGLNDAQRSVVTTVEGPVLCIAGPGSGKTKTLVERVVYLLSLGNKPQEIMIATFTEKAAKELLTRISNRLIELNIDVNPNELYIGTLHSIFLQLLEDYSQFTRLKRSYRLLEPFDQSFLVYKHFARFEKIENISHITGTGKGKWNSTTEIVSRLNTVSEENLDATLLAQSSDVAIVALSECYKLYLEILAEENAIDFSTIQTEILRMIDEHSDALEDIQSKIKYFMIDEYQDTNYIQEQILLKLSSKSRNICVVGDDDQGLYRFRGATIRNILQFTQNFKEGECRAIYLTTNYRSYPGIVQFYDRYMSEKNWERDGRHFRFDKAIIPHRKSCGTSSVVRLSSTGTTIDTYYQRVLDFILLLKEKGIVTDYNQICFLYKSVKTSEATGLMHFLEGQGIPVFCPRSGRFFERQEIRLMVGALFNLFPQLQQEGFIFSQMARFYETCNVALQDELQKDPQGNRELIAWILDKQRVHADLHKNTDYTFSGLLYQLFQFPLFAKYLQTELTASKQDLRPSYNIGILISIVCKYEYLYGIDILTTKNLNWALTSFFCIYMKFISDGGIEEFEDFDEITPSGNISFMTIHQSKGLEFPITIVGSMNGLPKKTYNDFDQLLQSEYYHRPIFEPLEDTKYFDFYRLYYTAFSRAQNLLVLTGWQHQGRGQGSIPSKYSKDIWESTPEWDSDTNIFNADALVLDEVKPSNIKHEYSFTSHVLLYERCPLQYKFYKELGFTAVRVGGTIAGTLLHNTIEDIHKAVLRGEESSVTNDNITSWFNTNYHLLVMSEHAYLGSAQRNSLLRYVISYKEHQKDSWHKIKEAEVDVSLVKKEYILKGTIDLIEAENGKVDIVDFKSGDKPDVNSLDPNIHRTLDQYRRQLEVYAHILEQKGYAINCLRLYYPKEENGNPCISYKFDHTKVSDTIESFDNIVSRIERKDFSMNPRLCNQQQCAECDMRHFCHK